LDVPETDVFDFLVAGGAGRPRQRQHDLVATAHLSGLEGFEMPGEEVLPARLLVVPVERDRDVPILPTDQEEGEP